MNEQQAELDLDRTSAALRGHALEMERLAHPGIEQCCQLIRSEDPNLRSLGATRLSNWMCYRSVLGSQIWKAVRELVLENLDCDETLEVLIIGFIEPATEEPVHPDDRDQLMEMLVDERMAMVVFTAYDRDGFPEHLHQDYSRWRVLVESLDRKVPDFPQLQLETYMEQSRRP